jgi:hypothetical protein
MKGKTRIGVPLHLSSQSSSRRILPDILEQKIPRTEILEQRIHNPPTDESCREYDIKRMFRQLSNRRLGSSRSKAFEFADIIEYERKLLELVKYRIERRNGYLKLFSLGCFFFIYVVTIFHQQNISATFGIESRYASFSCYTQKSWRLILTYSVIMSNIMGSLPTYGQGGYFNAGGPGANGLLSSSSDIVSWLQGIVQTIFPDAICGDGSCEADEQQGLGRFGWLVLITTPFSMASNSHLLWFSVQKIVAEFL